MVNTQSWVVRQMFAIEAVAQAWQIPPALGLAIRIAAGHIAYYVETGLITAEAGEAAYGVQFDDFERSAMTYPPRTPRRKPIPS